MSKTFKIGLAAAANVAGLVTAHSAAAQPAVAQPAAVQTYALPPQDLATSLREAALQAGVNLVVSSDLVAGRRAPALKGRYGFEAALERLLKGSRLRARQVGSAWIIGPEETGHGRPRSAAPGLDPNAIIVTGTNLRGVEPTSPVRILTRHDIEATGSTSVEEVMRKLPENSHGGVNKENFGAPLAGMDVSDSGAGLNLRGLGQRATLVLVDGRRLAPSSSGSFVDVSMIPLSAVDRIEILTDGASAIYGSDAVGGVVNIIMRKHFKGLETLVTAGSATSGDGDHLQLSQSGGVQWRTGRAMLAYDFLADDEIRARDRRYTIDLDPNEFLLPRERRHSLLGMAEQQIAGRLTLDVSAAYAKRQTNFTYYLTGSSLPIGADQHATSGSLSAELGYDLGGGWLARIDGSWSVARTHQTQTQPGGEELVNARRNRNSLADAGLTVDGPLVDLPGGAVKLALGATARREHYRDFFQTSFSSLPRAAGRSVTAEYAEVEVPFFSQLNARRGLEKLQLSAAVRHEQYSDFGSTVDPKVGLLWSPVSGLTVRSSWGTSFRAPLLSQTTGLYNAIYFPAPLLYLDPSQGQGVALVLQGSDPEIGPERARNWTAGGELSPSFVPGLTLRANYYSIRFKDRIAVPTPTVVVIGDPAFEPIITRNPLAGDAASLVGGAAIVADFSGGVATPADVTVILDDRATNTAITRTSGLDFGFSYDFAIGANRISLDGAFTHIFTYSNRLTPVSSPDDVLDSVYQPIDWRFRGGVGWANNRWSGNLFVNRAGAYADRRAMLERRVRDYTTVDAGLSYEFGAIGGGVLKSARFGLFADNLLNEKPPHIIADPESSSGLGYDPVNASAQGRVLSLQLRTRW